MGKKKLNEPNGMKNLIEKKTYWKTNSKKTVREKT